MDAARLRATPLFEKLSERDRENVARWADEVDVPAGKHLVDEGSCAYEFFVIESGRAEVRRRGERLGELGPGDFFGELALTGAGARTASVVALEPMTLVVMLDRDFRAMQEQMPHVADKVREAVRARMPAD